ncbi:MAG TPA: GntR family transcriptional regulator [Egicoccus sp.]|nr:GntR family transcriptional regulator [Egicoccus sp.]HSK23196.1 GntR family transcriptional regulator [Egicoccus sp.]
MALLRIDPDAAGPLHESIAGAVRRALATGELAPGDRLPAARELAEATGVDPNTVLRAYRTLRDEGLIDLRRGRGATVRDVAVDQARLTGLVDALMAEARRLGLGVDAVQRLVEERA